MFHQQHPSLADVFKLLFVFLFPLIKKKIKGVIVEYGRTLEIAGKKILLISKMKCETYNKQEMVWWGAFQEMENC